MADSQQRDKRSPVTFHIYRKDGSANPDIKTSFLLKRHLTAQEAVEGYIGLEDGTRWKIVLEQAVHQALKEQGEVHCIISFQARVDGNYAIARLFNPNHKPKRIKANG